VISERIIDSQPLKGHSSLFLYMAAAGVVGNRYLEDTRPTDTGTNVLFTPTDRRRRRVKSPWMAYPTRSTSPRPVSLAVGAVHWGRG